MFLVGVSGFRGEETRNSANILGPTSRRRRPDFHGLSDVIDSLPDKNDFLRVICPTGAYAELFASVYGVTVDECLAEGRAA